MDVTSSSVALTAEQQGVVGQDAAKRLLVNAAAGTGKTHVLVERLIHLVQAYGLFPGTEILVLSFSRAAVSEIRQRLSNTESSVAYVGVATFDSFATRLLADVDPSGSWTRASYDNRIRAAIEAICRPEAARCLKAVRHILIDEIQDLVGPRAELVLALLSGIPAGFTLFGDPAQRIYEYQVDPGEAISSADLYRLVHERFSESLTEMTLSVNFRALGKLPRQVLALGPRLQAAEPDYDRIRRDLDGLILQMPVLGDLRAVIPGWRHCPPNSDAILCRTNGQALLILKRLTDAGVSCRLKSAATDRAAPAWIGAAVLGYDSTRIGMTSMLERLTNTASESYAVGPDAKWRLLKLLDCRRSNDLDLRMIASRIVNRSAPHDLYEEPDEGVLISTIHRAKGLEFDRVIIMPRDAVDEHADCAEETRIEYVALTRARHWIGLMETPDTGNLIRDRGTRRWICARFRGRRRIVYAMEIRPDDTEQSLPPMFTGGQVDESVRDVAHYIRDCVRPGDPVSLCREPDATGDDNRYRLDHKGTSVGRASAEFVATMRRIIGARLPSSVDGLHVDGVATVAGNADEGRRCGLGSSGLWLAVRLIGIGALSFEDESQHANK